MRPKTCPHCGKTHCSGLPGEYCSYECMNARSNPAPAPDPVEAAFRYGYDWGVTDARTLDHSGNDAVGPDAAWERYRESRP